MRLGRWLSENRAAALIVGMVAVGVVALVTLSLHREPPVTYSPTVPEPLEVGDALIGPVRVTIDASDPDQWVYFDFSRRAPVLRPGSMDWDMAFRRFNVMVNGGAAFEGRGGVQALAVPRLDSIGVLPSSGYVTAEGADSVNPALAHWYRYGFTSHLLTPKELVYAVRTADGRYAAIRFLSYYCTGAAPGCMTFEYRYQGDGSRQMK